MGNIPPATCAAGQPDQAWGGSIQKALALADHVGHAFGRQAVIGTHERGAAVVVDVDHGQRIMAMVYQ